MEFWFIARKTNKIIKISFETFWAIFIEKEYSFIFSNPLKIEINIFDIRDIGTIIEDIFKNIVKELLLSIKLDI